MTGQQIPATAVDFEEYNSLPAICSYCQRPFTDNNRQTLDHIIAKSKVSSSKNRQKKKTFREISNLIVCCQQCNQFKGCSSLIMFKRELKSNKPKAEKVYRGKLTTVLRKTINQSIELLLTTNLDKNGVSRYAYDKTSRPRKIIGRQYVNIYKANINH